MVASFISIKGHIATIPLTEQKTVTASWYVMHAPGDRKMEYFASESPPGLT